MARRADVGAERHAQRLRAVRPDEDQSGVVDAHDHQVQRYVLVARSGFFSSISAIFLPCLATQTTDKSCASILGTDTRNCVSLHEQFVAEITSN